jgi:hypothetical protein
VDAVNRYTRNPGGLRELARDHAIAAATEAVGKAVISQASALSPSWQFSQSLEVLRTDVHGDEIVVSVGSRWGLAHLIEWGSRKNPAYAPLRRAVSSLGLRFDQS